MIAIQGGLPPIGRRWSGHLAIDPAMGRGEASFHAIEGVLPLGHGDAILREGRGEMSASRVADILELLRECALPRFRSVRGKWYDGSPVSMLICRVADGRIHKFAADACEDDVEPASRLATMLWETFHDFDLVETKRVRTVAWEDRTPDRPDEPQAR